MHVRESTTGLWLSCKIKEVGESSSYRGRRPAFESLTRMSIMYEPLLREIAVALQIAPRRSKSRSYLYITDKNGVPDFMLRDS
jgi:hypothetical protein